MMLRTEWANISSVFILGKTVSSSKCTTTMPEYSSLWLLCECQNPSRSNSVYSESGQELSRCSSRKSVYFLWMGNKGEKHMPGERANHTCSRRMRPLTYSTAQPQQGGQPDLDAWILFVPRGIFAALCYCSQDLELVLLRVPEGLQRPMKLALVLGLRCQPGSLLTLRAVIGANSNGLEHSPASPHGLDLLTLPSFPHQCAWSSLTLNSHLGDISLIHTDSQNFTPGNSRCFLMWVSR